ncbi:MAG: N-methyl-L-tryptophan oxidase [Acetobacteraceae bacterium]|nr:N-methyl-L-tryptophan oxidase [Acetobacteraceae bacterium]
MTYDVIVAGLGGMGSAAAFHLARRGARVLGLERFDIGHSLGSSHGLTRIIRLAYHEGAHYVPLLRRAYENWREAERLFGERLLFVTGSIDAGPEGSRVVQGALRSCVAHDLPHEVLDPGELARRFPGYALPAGFQAVYQPDGGFVASERAIIAHITLAQAAGAELHARERVLGWEPVGEGVRVRTERASYAARRLIFAAGAWVGQFVPALAGQAVPERQVLGWFQPAEPALFEPPRFPVFNLIGADGHWYGTPVWGMPGVKIGRYHHRHQTIDPDDRVRGCDAEDEAVLRTCLRRYFPKADGPVLRLAACIFTNLPDGHFVIDRLPGLPQVVVASPCSGHGYKFCSVVGEILTDLALQGGSRFDLEPFRLERDRLRQNCQKG